MQTADLSIFSYSCLIAGKCLLVVWDGIRPLVSFTFSYPYFSYFGFIKTIFSICIYFDVVDDLTNYFSRYGAVARCTLKSEGASGQNRGFGFVIFQDKNTINKVISKHFMNSFTSCNRNFLITIFSQYFIVMSLDPFIRFCKIRIMSSMAEWLTQSAPWLVEARKPKGRYLLAVWTQA